MNTQHAHELKEHPQVLELKAIQEALGLPDNDFARTTRFAYSGSSWGKIKAGTFAGNPEKAIAAVKRALADYRAGGDVETRHGIVVLPHVQAALDAVAIARVAKDEHRLVIIAGEPGAGKSSTAAMLGAEYGGHYLHAHPSWAASYLRSLIGLARALGMSGDFRSTGAAETGILDHLRASPSLLIIDEANHFSRELVNFLKTILNETRCALVLCTLPGHLARMNAIHSEESRQLLRRAVAIIHIQPVSSADVLAIHAALFSDVPLGNAAVSLAAAANRMHRCDTICRVFGETEPGEPDDLPRAIERIEKSLRSVTAIRP